MDFEQLFEQWERSRPDLAEVAMEGREEPEDKPQLPKSRLKRLKPQRTLDLHGYTAEEASAAVDAFLKESSESGVQKVLIIHGKGYHSQQGVPVLRKVVYHCLDASPYAGERGIPERNLGGSGAVWVLLKQKKV
jgi:DNA-nicking Smr family endonuclease